MNRMSRETRSLLMSKIRSKHTAPEVNLRRALRELGVHYNLHYSKEKIDIAIPGRKTAIFVDGCFWHGCPRHGRKPKSNKAYWLPKLRRNKERDKETSARLRGSGWQVLRFWEHDVEKRVEWCCSKIVCSLRAAR